MIGDLRGDVGQRTGEFGGLLRAIEGVEEQPADVFAVQIVTDQAYRAEFAEDMTSEIRDALAVRAVYHRRLV